MHVTSTNVYCLTINGTKELHADKQIVHSVLVNSNGANFSLFCWVKIGTEGITCTNRTLCLTDVRLSGVDRNGQNGSENTTYSTTNADTAQNTAKTVK